MQRWQRISRMRQPDSREETQRDISWWTRCIISVVPELCRSCTGVVPIQKFRFHIYIPGRTRNFATKDGNWWKSNQVLPYSSKALYIAALTLDDSLTMILSKSTTIIVRSRYTRSCFRSKLQARNAQISSAKSLFATFSMFCKSSCK